MAIKNVFCALRPGWFLLKGTIYVKESELDKASESCERWALWSAALVIVSVIGEFVIAYIDPPYNLFMTYSVFTDAGVGLGIVGEVFFGMLNNRIQTELRRRSDEKLGSANERAGIANDNAASAIERAAKLEKEAAETRLTLIRSNLVLAEMQARALPRHLLGAQKAQLIDLLKNAPKPKLVVVSKAGDPEARQYESELSLFFRREAQYPQGNTSRGGPFLNATVGVFILVTEREYPPSGTEELMKALKVVEINVGLIQELIPGDPETVVVFVGQKP